MQKLSNSSFLNLLSKLLFFLVLAKGLSLVLLFVLPNKGVEVNAEHNFQQNYHRVDFSLMIQKSTQQKNVQKKYNIQASGVTLTSMVLKGLYGEGSKGFAIIALKKSPVKTSIVSVGEIYSDYKLKFILKDAVIFTKNHKEYKLMIKKDNKLKESYVKQVKEEDNSVRKVSNQDIQHYVKNPDAIWKEISIEQLPHNKGFEIRRVKEHSKMAALGLKKGDIMIRANNRDLLSYKDAIDLYQQLNTLQVIQIVVLRNNQEKEFVYEIN